MSLNESTNAASSPSPIGGAKPQEAVLAAIRELEFGTVEVIIHQGEIREIRQIRKKRFAHSPGHRTI
jgi:hypothetical protein